MRKIFISIPLLLASLFIAAACGGDSEEFQTTPPPVDDAKALGQSSATVTIVEYADFQ